MDWERVASKVMEVFHHSGKWSLDNTDWDLDADPANFRIVDLEQQAKDKAERAARLSAEEQRRNAEGECWYCQKIGAPKVWKGHAACTECFAKASAD